MSECYFLPLLEIAPRLLPSLLEVAKQTTSHVLSFAYQVIQFQFPLVIMELITLEAQELELQATLKIDFPRRQRYRTRGDVVILFQNDDENLVLEYKKLALISKNEQ